MLPYLLLSAPVDDVDPDAEEEWTVFHDLAQRTAPPPPVPRGLAIRFRVDLPAGSMVYARVLEWYH